MYNILEVIFSSQRLVGCGTIYYLTWRGDEEYIIKDHWILGSKVDALNEVKMLQMKAELLATIWDIIKIQQIEVEEKGILHHNCSLNNSMIEDDGNGFCGTLIDWEFTVFIAQGQKYARGRTLSKAVSSIVTPECSLKCASNSHMVPARLTIHCFEDDLKGPLGVKHVLDKRYNWLVHKWSAITFKACNDEKTTFFYHLYVHKFEEQFHPYFKNLVLSAVEWYEFIRNKGLLNAVTFQEVLDLLDKHLTKLLKEHSPELLFICKILEELLLSDIPVPTINPGQEQECQTVGVLRGFYI
ncbi:hypothetical protein EDD22DRAFT_849606 [Suillus occidentalis]|nr:hypothetical protein EDD22DRAFT_849606 [Suillus occidentalis]